MGYKVKRQNVRSGDAQYQLSKQKYNDNGNTFQNQKTKWKQKVFPAPQPKKLQQTYCEGKYEVIPTEATGRENFSLHELNEMKFERQSRDF